MNNTTNFNEIFKEVTQRICGTMDIHQALDETHRYLSQFIPIDLMVLANGNFEVGYIHCYAISDHNSGISVREHTYLSSIAHSKFRKNGKDFFSGSILRKYDKLNRTDNPAEYEVFGIKEQKNLNYSSFSMSLKIDQTPQGVLTIMAKGEAKYSEFHQAIIKMLYQPFAIAMSNYQQYKEVIEIKEMLESENKRLNEELNHFWKGKIIGSAGGLKEVMAMTQQVSKLDSPVLLLGETGVGKEVIANEIHHLSNRKHKPFIKVNCGAIPENLIDSELFGHEKGAFTGAASFKQGRFERATGGTIFLDEIGELPLQAQVRLLRVIQNKEIERVGGTKTIPVDVRIISATHRSLEEMVKNQLFREDLWYRINVFPIRIPPLRQRKEDILELIDFFIKRKSAELKIVPAPKLAEGEGDYLIDLPWRGNVRELENTVERALILMRGQEENLPLIFSRTENVLQLAPQQTRPVIQTGENKPFPTLDELQYHHIQAALKKCNGKIHGSTGAANLLKINPHTLRSRMKKLNISFGKSKT